MKPGNESEIFTSYCGDMLTSANDVDTLFMYSAIAITAWNNADKTGADIAVAVESLEKRLKCTAIQNDDKTVSIKDLTTMMIERKNCDFKQHEFRVLRANFEDQNNQIKVNVETASR